MSLTEFYCESFEIEAQFRSEDFDKEAFFEDAAPTNVDGSIFRWSFGSTEKKDVEHGHLYLRLPTIREGEKESKGKIILAYHTSDAEINDVRPPYMEEMGIWLGQFFKSDDLLTYINAIFRFDEKFEPTLGLPFPLVTENKALSGSTVSGVTIEPPAQSPLRRVMIQRTDADTIVYAMGRGRINLRAFDLSKEIEKVSTQVRGLIREKKEGRNESGTP